jgi:hypothetical protein
MLISALGLNLGHLGVNNGFLVETGHELAMRYNDRSPLENMHCAELFRLCSMSDSNILQSLPKEQHREIRKHCIEMILQSDMANHFSMVKEASIMYETNSEMCDACIDIEKVKACKCLCENTKLVMNLTLHSADLCHSYQCWDVCETWSKLVMNEFFAQGDQEKSLGIPVQMLNDRSKVSIPHSQIGYIEFLMAPLVQAQVSLFPTLGDIAQNLGHNMERWADAWIVETTPDDGAKASVQARVCKTQNKLKGKA